MGVQIHMSPILYRYIDWSITVPLQMIEFYLILSACSKDITQASFWKLLIGTVIMLAAGYLASLATCWGAHGPALPLACWDGSSSCSRSLEVRLARLLASF